MARISPTNTELLSHVRSLSLFAPWEFPNWSPRPINAFFDCLPSFRYLRHLTLRNVRIGSDISERLEVFSAFRYTLSSLTFQDFFLTWSTFIAMVDYFPGVGDLVIDNPTWETDHRQASPLSRPLRGRLSIQIWKGHPIFADRICELEVECDELLILGSSDYDPTTRHYQRIINTCGKSLKRLSLSPCACTLQYARDYMLRTSADTTP